MVVSVGGVHHETGIFLAFADTSHGTRLMSFQFVQDNVITN